VLCVSLGVLVIMMTAMFLIHTFMLYIISFLLRCYTILSVTRVINNHVMMVLLFFVIRLSFLCLLYVFLFLF